MFYERLKAICDLRKTTITAVVRAVSGSTGSVDGWKKGRAPSSDIVVRMAKHLGITTDFLLGLSDNPVPTQEMDLAQNETNLIVSLREADPNIRDAVLKMASAVLDTRNVPNDAFLSSNDGICHQVEERKPTKARKFHKRVEGETAAGAPITAVPAEDEAVFVPEKYLEERFFVIRARGESMIPLIPDGACCVFNRDASIDDGCIVLAQIDGLTDQPDDAIKRIYRRGSQVELRSENPEFGPMLYPAAGVHISGVLVEVL